MCIRDSYLGGGYAFGKGLYAPGWRLRSVASYGRYRYDGSLANLQKRLDKIERVCTSSENPETPQAPSTSQKVNQPQREGTLSS